MIKLQVEMARMREEIGRMRRASAYSPSPIYSAAVAAPLYGHFTPASVMSASALRTVAAAAGKSPATAATVPLATSPARGVSQGAISPVIVPAKFQEASTFPQPSTVSKENSQSEPKSRSSSAARGDSKSRSSSAARTTATAKRLSHEYEKRKSQNMEGADQPAGSSPKIDTLPGQPSPKSEAQQAAASPKLDSQGSASNLQVPALIEPEPEAQERGRDRRRVMHHSRRSLSLDERAMAQFQLQLAEIIKAADLEVRDSDDDDGDVEPPAE
eukprot:TRINITY_DN6707_c0_g1_i1.p1 TRINITY_DN6707_c0_g1~~TRINITY_DN6707_c0_g1_i1.p1  ORF type:complete len:271 (-),score=48.17 TRINITY_DN6707_c0_g1_i1:57-869(-)